MTNEDLQRLGALRDAGELSFEEYEQAARLASAEASPAAPPIGHGGQADGWSTSVRTPLPPPAAPPGRSWFARNPWIALVGVVVIGLVVMSGNDEQQQLEALASDTCDSLNEAIMLQVGYILGDAIEDAEALGFTGVDLGDEMRSSCPATMAAVEEWVNEY